MLHYKKFKTYEDYTEAQVAKVRGREDYIRRKSGRKLSDFLVDFVRFENHIPQGCKVLCLGARFGEEVRAFRRLGYDAIGIDLWADEEDLVIKGDWNDLPWEKEFDVIYTNSIDHANNIETLIDQIKKALKPVGKVIIALDQNHTQSGSDSAIQRKFRNTARYEAMLWNKDEDVTDAFVGFELKEKWLNWRWHTYLMERSAGLDTQS
jgi:SAM-dependent methyltransferase